MTFCGSARRLRRVAAHRPSGAHPWGIITLSVSGEGKKKSAAEHRHGRRRHTDKQGQRPGANSRDQREFTATATVREVIGSDGTSLGSTVRGIGMIPGF